MSLINRFYNKKYNHFELLYHGKNIMIKMALLYIKYGIGIQKVVVF